MSSIENNKLYYSEYDWTRGGAEWSHYWGGLDPMWKASLLPRISRYLPARRILEIGAGCGRVSSKLRPLASERLWLVDIIPHCVNSCRSLFREDPKVISLLTDGQSLDGIDDDSIDLVVSFYSLVDSDIETLRAYMAELQRVLSQNGVAFIHHSNTGVYVGDKNPADDPRLELLSRYRDISISASVMQQLVEDAGLRVIEQECVNWDIQEVLSDCFTTLTRRKSVWESIGISDNYEFQDERDRAKAARSASKTGKDA